ncbi:MAG TPA: NAD(P)-binding domain-containing protein [Myxococcales bacterium]|nr:NAD(P)-binding domain-containing protein [Myxococcales bacterium]
MKAKVAIAGDGNVGSNLQKGLSKAGYEATAVGREPKKLREKALEASIIVLAVPFGAVDDTLRELGDAVNGKILVDATNRLDKSMHLQPGPASGAEELQKKVPKAKVVKALNTTFAATMSHGAAKGGEKITIFAASDDKDARKTVAQMARDIGFDAVEAGPLRNAQYLEALAVLNIQLAYAEGFGAEMGFRLAR